MGELVTNKLLSKEQIVYVAERRRLENALRTSE